MNHRTMNHRTMNYRTTNHRTTNHTNQTNNWRSLRQYDIGFQDASFQGRNWLKLLEIIKTVRTEKSAKEVKDKKQIFIKDIESCVPQSHAA